MWMHLGIRGVLTHQHVFADFAIAIMTLKNGCFCCVQLPSPGELASGGCFIWVGSKVRISEVNRSHLLLNIYIQSGHNIEP